MLGEAVSKQTGDLEYWYSRGKHKGDDVLIVQEYGSKEGCDIVHDSAGSGRHKRVDLGTTLVFRCG